MEAIQVGLPLGTKVCREEILKGPSRKGNKQFVKLLCGIEYTTKTPSVVYISSSLYYTCLGLLNLGLSIILYAFMLLGEGKEYLSVLY